VTSVSRLPSHIVCGVDFSEASTRAVAWAHMLAGRLGRRLVVLAAIEPLLANAARAQSGPAQFLEDARRDLDRFVAPIVGRTADQVTLEIAVGEPETLLLDAASRLDAIAVVGTHGLGRAERMFFGSTTLRVMRAATRPVLAVPRRGPAPGETEWRPDLQRLVCGVDFSAASVAAARAAHTLGAALSVPLTLVHAVTILTVPTVWDVVLAPPEDEQLEAARAQLDAIARDLGDPVPATLARLGHPEDVLAADAGNGTLIALGLGDLGGHRPGTTAMHVMAETKVPVLAVPSTLE
jgi:nucleotide-binding universal stress UspA family protein